MQSDSALQPYSAQFGFPYRSVERCLTSTWCESKGVDPLSRIRRMPEQIDSTGHADRVALEYQNRRRLKTFQEARLRPSSSRSSRPRPRAARTPARTDRYSSVPASQPIAEFVGIYATCGSKVSLGPTLSSPTRQSNRNENPTEIHLSTL